MKKIILYAILMCLTSQVKSQAVSFLKFNKNNEVTENYTVDLYPEIITQIYADQLTKSVINKRPEVLSSDVEDANYEAYSFQCMIRGRNNDKAAVQIDFWCALNKTGNLRITKLLIGNTFAGNDRNDPQYLAYRREYYQSDDYGSFGVDGFEWHWFDQTSQLNYNPWTVISLEEFIRARLKACIEPDCEQSFDLKVALK